MNSADQLLEKLGIKFEDLDKPGFSGEKQAYFDLLKRDEKNPLTVEQIRLNIMRMRYAVEMQLTDPKVKLNTDEDRDLKARLRNYILLESILYGTLTTEHMTDIEKMLK